VQIRTELVTREPAKETNKIEPWRLTVYYFKIMVKKFHAPHLGALRETTVPQQASKSTISLM